MALVGAGDCGRKLIGAVDQGTSSSRFLVHCQSSFSSRFCNLGIPAAFLILKSQDFGIKNSRRVN